jgi:hypothetical protein
MYWANPVSYAFQGLASNEFWDREFKCTSGELMPPSDVPNFNQLFPGGFEGKLHTTRSKTNKNQYKLIIIIIIIMRMGQTGNQACPITSGTDYIIDNYGIWDKDWLKWIMAVCVIGWWFIFTLVTYIGLRFVRHSPPRKPRMKNVEVSEEEALEMKQFNIKAVKAQHKKQHGSHAGHHEHDKEKQGSSSSTRLFTLDLQHERLNNKATSVFACQQVALASLRTCWRSAGVSSLRAERICRGRNSTTRFSCGTA